LKNALARRTPDL